jgi:hypothetical protein
MTTDWVLVMVSVSCNAVVDSFLVLERRLVATKDPEGENDASRGDNLPRSALPMVSLAKSEQSSALQSRMTDIACVRAKQTLSAPPAKKREHIIAPPPESKEWMHACSFMFHTLILPHAPAEAKRLESVCEKDSAAEEKRLPRRIVSACFGVRVGPSMWGFE